MRLFKEWVAVAAIALGAVAQAQMMQQQIYDVNADAKAEISAAIKTAHAEHKRVLLDFGGNWCGDCIVLDRNFHMPENQALLNSDYVVVHVDIGKFDKNMDIAQRYGIPLEKGVPALAVVDGMGRLIYAQKNGEFESMRRMDPSSVHAFLEQWKPAAK
jgi:thiol:disulfide interchange protein